MRIGVFGLGNVLRGDDGFGPSAVERLAAGWALPDEIVMGDLGTPGLDLASHLMGLDVLILFDAIEAEDDEPGTLHVFRKADILEHAVQGWRTSTHQSGLREALWVTDAIGQCPSEVSLIGVVPASLETGTGLSPEVEAQVDPACRLAVQLLHGFGIDAAPRDAPTPSVAWWEEHRSIGESPRT